MSDDWRVTLTCWFQVNTHQRASYHQLAFPFIFENHPFHLSWSSDSNRANYLVWHAIKSKTSSYPTTNAHVSCALNLERMQTKTSSNHKATLTVSARDGNWSWVRWVKKMGESAWVVGQFSAKSCGSRWVVGHSSYRCNFTLLLKNSEN